MELAIFIYLIDTICTRPDSLYVAALLCCVVLSAICMVLSKLVEEFSALGKLNSKPLLIACLVLLGIYMLVPSQKTAYTMLGAYGIQIFATTVYENDQAKRIATNSLNLVEAAISKYEKDLKGE